MQTSIKDAIAFIDCDCSREEWLKIGASLYSCTATGSGEGFKLFNEWSMLSQGYDFRTTKNAWVGFRKTESNITVATLFYAAFKAGWKGEGPHKQLLENDDDETASA